MLKLILGLSLVSLLAADASAGVISGSSDLLLPQDAALIENAIGLGPLVFTKAFDKEAGNTSLDFHAALDGKGPNVVVVEVIAISGVALATPIRIGGYCPSGWSAGISEVFTPNPVDRTALLFNLDAGLVRSQNPTAPEGIVQIMNAPDMGPIFGGGNDLRIDGTLNNGYSYAISYGTEVNGVPVGFPGHLAGGPQPVGPIGSHYFYGAMEVFTVAPQIWFDLGSGKEGSAGVPDLKGAGSLAANSPCSLALTSGDSNATAALVVGLSAINAQFKGGTLVPAPHFLGNLATNSAGEVLLPFIWPAGIPEGTQVFFQYWLQDDAASFGLSASNALKGVSQ